ncbi:MAG: sensor histidine kinase [Gloeobacteraceae cyanobacterium ES-bin-144]|nr:sensor histidine kinase [Verrucomicrobiales bacterium]
MNSSPINRRKHDSLDNSDRECLQNPFTRPEVRIAVCYTILSCGWIIGSDSLLYHLVGEASENLFFQTLKGLNFVIATGGLLYLVLRRSFGGWRKSEERRMVAMRSARERFRSLSSRIQTLREEERTRISREIHDQLGQILTGIKMHLRLIEDRLSKREDRTMNPVIDDLIETSSMIDDTIEAVRRIASGLRPLALDDLGLAAGMSEELEQFTRRTGIDSRLEIGKMDNAIPPDLETAAFRIFQESLTNVARHSKAKRIDAACLIHDGELVLTVQDDGVGADPLLIEHSDSLGLIGMLERAADAGGTLSFKSSPNHGMGVTLKIPLDEKNHASSAQ